MGARRHGQGRHLPPGNVIKCFLCCKCYLRSQYYFENMLLQLLRQNPHISNGALPPPPGLAPAGGLPSFRFPHCPHQKKILRAAMVKTKTVYHQRTRSMPSVNAFIRGILQRAMPGCFWAHFINSTEFT